MTRGASNFDVAADHDVLFNWYFVFFYASSAVGSTAIVYVQDNVSWALGYAISGAGGARCAARRHAELPPARRSGHHEQCSRATDKDATSEALLALLLQATASGKKTMPFHTSLPFIFSVVRSSVMVPSGHPTL